MNDDEKKKSKFVKKELQVFQKSGDEFETVNRYVICLSIDGILYPHPVTDFIDKKFHFKSISLNSERAATDIVVHFLNYVLTQVEIKNSFFKNVKGIKDLNLSHLECYLEYCGEIQNNRNTVERKEYYLLKFYYYFGYEKKIINTKLDLKKSQEKSKRIMADLYYKKPSKKSHNSTYLKKKDLVTQQWNDVNDKRQVRLFFIREFLLLASTESPDIAFAIAIQMFGGLRSAECMNLTIDSLVSQGNSIFGEKGLVVEVRDRQHFLFKSNDISHNDQVKKERDQAILIDPLIPFLYEKHLVWLKNKKKYQNKKNAFNDFALFVNNDGNAMRTHTYRQKFNNLKHTYLGVLKNTSGRYNDFQELRNTKWSTHICRGVFTNLCLDSGFNATQTSIMRGDSNPDSLIAYSDILTASYKISQVIDTISKTSMDKFYDLMDYNLNKQWIEVINNADRDF